MSFFEEKKKEQENRPARSGGNGNYVAKTTVAVTYNGHEQVGDRTVVNVTLLSDALGEKFPAGSEQQVTFSERRNESMEKYLAKLIKGKNVSKGGSLILGNVGLANGKLECDAITNFTPEMDNERNIVWADKYIKAKEVDPAGSRTNKTPRNRQVFEIYHADEAIPLVGDDSINPFEKMLDQYRSMGVEEGLEEVEAAAEAYNAASPIEKMAYAIEYFNANANLQNFSNNVNYAMRVINLDGDPNNRDTTFDVCTFYGKKVQDEETGEYRAANFNELMDARLSSVPEEKRDSPYYKSLSRHIGALNDPSAAFGDANVLVEIIPIGVSEAGPVIWDAGEELVATRNEQVKAWNPEWTEGKTNNVIVKGHVAFRAYESNGEPTEKFFVNKVESVLPRYGKNIGWGAGAKAYGITSLVTPALAKHENFVLNAEESATNAAKRYDPRNWNNSNENSNDGGSPDYDSEAEGYSPGM